VRVAAWFIVVQGLAILSAAPFRLADGSASIVGRVQQYEVRKGDSLTGIGARFGVDIRAVATDNLIAPKAILKPGQILSIDNRHIVPPGPIDGVLINIPQRMLFVAWDGRLAGAYPIAAGGPGWQTPTGVFEISFKEINPTWDVPISIQREMAQAGKAVLTVVPPGPQNPLGDRWIGLENSSVGIHGTNAPSSIYRLATHGCIRLHPEDARALFELVEPGMTVSFIYAPIMAAEDGGRLWLEVHADSYRRIADATQLAIAALAALGASEGFDEEAVRLCLRERQGRLCDVTLHTVH